MSGTKLELMRESVISLGLGEVTTDLIKTLKGFGATLAQSQVQEKAQEFLPKILQKADLLGLKRVTIADRCRVSVPTISRWAAGRVTPHALMARVAIDVIRDLAVEKVLEYQSEIEQRDGKRRPN